MPRPPELTFEEFERRVHRAFAEIPAEFRDGISGPVVLRTRKASREGDGRLTLGECAHAPGWGGESELTSTIFFYYGSFVASAAGDPSFDWDAEITETVRHEVQHHVEDQAGHLRLRDQDLAEDEHSRWERGEEHAPAYWRRAELHGTCRVPLAGNAPLAVHGIGRDLFVEVPLRGAPWRTAVREGIDLTFTPPAAGTASGGTTIRLPPRTDGAPGTAAEGAPASGSGTRPPRTLRYLVPGKGRSVLGSPPGDLHLILRRTFGWRDLLPPWGQA